MANGAKPALRGRFQLDALQQASFGVQTAFGVAFQAVGDVGVRLELLWKVDAGMADDLIGAEMRSTVTPVVDCHPRMQQPELSQMCAQPLLDMHGEQGSFLKDSAEHGNVSLMNSTTPDAHQPNHVSQSRRREVQRAWLDRADWQCRALLIHSWLLIPQTLNIERKR